LRLRLTNRFTRDGSGFGEAQRSFWNVMHQD
jgi:hypothetical protein